MAERQTTIRRAVSTRGIGLHTGVNVCLRLCPAPAYTGLIFRRVDLDGFEIPASPQYVAQVSYRTALVNKGVLVATVEHVLAALYGSGIDNAIIEIDGFEVPIMDGSAGPFVELIQDAGKTKLDAPRQCVRILKPVQVSEGLKSARATPAERFSILYTIDFDHPLIGRQQKEFFVDEATFAREIAPARTFTLLEEVESLQRMGLIRGGSLENAIVLDHNGILNQGGLRYPDEFVRHKIIDIIGDLALCGRPILGRIEAERGGHALHNALVAKLLQEPRAWKIMEASRVRTHASH